jgi:heme exporter protein D
MMAAAEAMHPQGTILGAIFTFLLYGALPLSIVMYLMGTPMRRRARHLQEQAERARAQDIDAHQMETRGTTGKPETSSNDSLRKES